MLYLLAFEALFKNIKNTPFFIFHSVFHGKFCKNAKF